VPSEELKLIRKQILVEKLMRSEGGQKKKVPVVEVDNDTKTHLEPIAIPPANAKPPSFKTRKFESSSVLSRVKEFLPLMKTENTKLLQRMKQDPNVSSIEVDLKEDETDSNGGPLIEMNLALFHDSDDSSNSDNNEGEEGERV